jgi:hypothetical protein
MKIAGAGDELQGIKRYGNGGCDCHQQSGWR